MIYSPYATLPQEIVHMLLMQPARKVSDRHSTCESPPTVDDGHPAHAVRLRARSATGSAASLFLPTFCGTEEKKIHHDGQTYTHRSKQDPLCACHSSFLPKMVFIAKMAISKSNAVEGET